MTLLLVYLAIAIGVSFLCSILEAVLLSITPSYLAQLTQARPKSGRAIQAVKDRLDESLSSILILNTFAHTMGAAGVGAQALRVFGPEAETLIAVLLTLAILYFSEIIPKTLGQPTGGNWPCHRLSRSPGLCGWCTLWFGYRPA